MNWTTPQDIRERWIGDDVPDNDQLLRALIQDAEAIILSTYPAIQARVTAGKLSAAIITFVTTRMVTRVLRNPDNATYSSQTTGPFTSAKNVGDVDLWMTPDEEEMLSPIVPGKAFSVDLAPYAGIGIGNLIMTGNGYEEGAPYLPPLHQPGCGCESCGYSRGTLNNLPYPYTELED
jgi:hypothetical protein